MARMTSTAISREGRPDAVVAWGASPEARQRMIMDAAYFRYEHRGYDHGHDLDDWLAAEAEVDRANRRRQPSAQATILAFEPQQSSTLGPRADDALKRMIKQHPRRDISRVEGMEPEDAPLKE